MSLVFHAPLLGTPQFKDTVQNSFVSSSGTAEIMSTSYLGPRLRLSGSGTSYLKYSPNLHKTSRITIAFWYCPESYADTSVAWKDVIKLHTTSLDGTIGRDFRLEKWGDGSTYHKWYNNELATHDGGVECGNIGIDCWYHIILSVDTKTGYWKSLLYDYSTGVTNVHTENQIVKPCYFDNDIYIIKEDNVSKAHYSDIRIYDDFISDYEIAEIRKRPILHYNFDSDKIYDVVNSVNPLFSNVDISDDSNIGNSCALFNYEEDVEHELTGFTFSGNRLTSVNISGSDIIIPSSYSIVDNKFYSGNDTQVTACYNSGSNNPVIPSSLNYTSLVFPDSITDYGTGPYGITGTTIPATCKTLIIGDGFGTTPIYSSYIFGHTLLCENIIVGTGFNASTQIQSGSMGYVFGNNNSTGVKTITFKATTPAPIANYTLSNFPNLQTIYVPNSAVNTYKNATNWSALASKIVGIDINSINTNYDYIAIPRDAMQERRLTFNAWAYMDDWSQINNNDSGRIASCTENGGWNFEYGGREGFENTYNNFIYSLQDNAYIIVEGKNPAELSHGWHMFTLTFDGSYARQYVDGELTGQSDLFAGAPEGRIKYNSSNAIFLGVEAGASTTSPDNRCYFNGKMSDVKIYGTALSVDDIKREFNTRAYLTNKNELLASSINESQKTSIDEKGNYSSQYIVENQYYYTKDGAKFLKIFSHDVRNSAELFPADPHEVVTNYITDSTNRFSRLKDIPLCRSVDNFTQLPSGYTPLSYIYVSDAYINTLESATPNTKIRLDIQFDSVETRQQRLWCAGDDLRFDSYINGNGYWAFAYKDDGGNWIATTKVADNMRHIFEMDGKNKTYKIWNALGAQECINMSLSSYTATKTSTPIYLFKDVSGGVTTKARVFSCQIWQDGTLTKNFIPAKNSNNTYGFFDTVSQTFFTREENAGTISGGVNNYYEFLLRYPEASEILYNRWRQTANPLTTLSAEGQTVKSMGYEPIEIAWSTNWKYGMGFRKANIPNTYYGPESYLDCQVGDSSWYGGIGQNTLWNGGFPAPDGNAYKYVELYIRVDNTEYNNPASIRKEDLIPSKLKLPNLIQEYTYLEVRSEATVDNGCYFDTGYVPNADTEIEIKFKINSMENGIFVFGAGGSAYDDAAFELYNWDNNWEFNYGTDGGATRVPATTDICTFTFKDKVAKFSNSEITSTRTVTTLPTKSLYLFALNRTGGAVYGGSSRIYYCKIWEKGKLIKHYVPAIWQYSYPSGAAYSSSSYNVGFYDVINNIYYSAKFSNGIPSSSGGWYNPFTGIPASYVTNYENWEDGYQPVEYIESTGTQYINTGYAHDTKYTHYEFDFMLTNRPNTYHSVFGSRLTHDGNEAYYLGIHNDGHAYACIGGNKKDPLGFNLSNNIKYKIEIDPNRGVTCDGVLYSQPYTTQTHFTAQNDYIFALNENGAPIEYMSGKLYRFKIWYNKDFLMRDFIPCYRKSDGAIGLYDRVYQHFYENDGTGTFIKGPDIANEHITTFMDEFKEM